MLELKVAKVEGCQNWKLPKLKVAKIESCYFKIVKIENCQNQKLPKLKVSKLKLPKLSKLKVAKLKLPKLKIAKLLNCQNWLGYLFEIILALLKVFFSEIFKSPKELL